MTPSRGRAEPLVTIVEDHLLFAEALDLALQAEGYAVRRVRAPEDPTAPVALVTEILKRHPQVVLLDLDLGAFGDATQLVQPVAAGGAHVVVVTGSPDRARWGGAVRAGARTVVSKTQPLSDVLTTVRRVLTGLPVMDRDERAELVQEWTDRQRELEGVRERLDQLTIRESQVLGHLMKGRAVRQIADLGAVSEATVRTQVKSILAKLAVPSQLAAVGVAHETGWQPPAP